MKCFYHNDQDGIVSGYYVRKACEKRDVNFEQDDFRKINYGMRFPFKDIKQNELVFIVDYSIEPDEMWQLLSITKNVIWIDHHQSAIDKYKDFKCNVKGIRVTGAGISGANLTWWYLSNCVNKSFDEYCNWDGMNALVDMLQSSLSNYTPILAKYTAAWDTFTWEDEREAEKIKAFHLVFESYNFSPMSGLLGMLNIENIAEKMTEDMIHEGLKIMKYMNSNAKRYLEAYGFETVFEGYKVYAINSAFISSDFFKSIDASKYDIFIGFVYKGDEDKWEYQLRSAEPDKVNVCELAVKYGGGGHPNAAGFRSDKYVLGV